MKNFFLKTIATSALVLIGMSATAKTCSFNTIQGPILCDQHIGRVPDCGAQCLDMTNKLVVVVGGSKVSAKQRRKDLLPQELK